MAKGRQRWEWRMVATLLSKLHNVHCADRKDLLTPDDFDIFKTAKPKASGVSFKQQVAAMKSLFAGG